jgi:hypothetical protein
MDARLDSLLVMGFYLMVGFILDSDLRALHTAHCTLHLHTPFASPFIPAPGSLIHIPLHPLGQAGLSAHERAANAG